MSRVLDEAVERLRIETFYSELDAAYERLEADPAALAEDGAEREAWDVTLADGLDEDGD